MLYKCIQYTFCSAAIFLMVLEAIHIVFYSHNGFLMGAVSIISEFFWQLWFLFIFSTFVPSLFVLPFYCLLVLNVAFQKLKLPTGHLVSVFCSWLLPSHLSTFQTSDCFLCVLVLFYRGSA